MLGMIEGNGHPYSWSAIFNGYDAEAMARCPYPVIPEYLGRQPKETLGIPGARVTHIWTDDPADAPRVAKAARIPHVVTRPEDVIGHVDAVIIPTDNGGEHASRCRPFIEAGLPVFVDKPLAGNEPDLRTFQAWAAEGRVFLSSSCMAYAKEFLPYRESTHELGQLRYASITTPKSWERYGIHALSAIYPILGPGFISATNTGSATRNVVHLKHTREIDVTVVAIDDLYGAFGLLQVCGTSGSVQAAFKDTFYAFKAQLVAFVNYLRTGIPPFPFSETEELMCILIAGTRSREQNAREVPISEIAPA
jgi:hypothetical protein